MATNRPGYRAIRTARWKWGEYDDGERELYDLQADPHELQSRHAAPSTLAVRKQLAARLSVVSKGAGVTWTWEARQRSRRARRSGPASCSGCQGRACPALRSAPPP